MADFDFKRTKDAPNDGEVLRYQAASDDWKPQPMVPDSDVVTADDAAPYPTAVGNGAIPVVLRVAVPNAATADIDTVCAEKVEVHSVRFIKTSGAGAAGNLITLKNVATAITDDMDTNVADKAIVDAATIDDAQFVIAAGTVMRISSVRAGGDCAGIVIVTGVKKQ